MKVISVLKGGVSLAAGVGASKIAGYAIKKLVPEAVSKSEKVLIVVGTFAIGGAVGKVASDYVEKLIDEIVDAGETVIELIKEKKDDNE